MAKSHDRKHWEERFLALIPVGRCRAVSMNQLADMACPSGYFSPATLAEELSVYLAHRTRARSNLVSLKATRKHLREMGIDLRGR